MPTEKREPNTELIDTLLKAPYRFDLVQALRLLELWLRRRGVSSELAFADIFRFRNSMSLSFPACEIEHLSVETNAENGVLRRIVLTPAFMSLLGASGVLPQHYSEEIAAYISSEGNDGPRAFMDVFFSELVVQFYKGWRKYRLELPSGTQECGALLPVLLTLSGRPEGGEQKRIPSEAAAYYAAAFRQRPASPFVIERVLADYFAIPVTLETNAGHWQLIAPELQARLGARNACLGKRCVLGTRQWRRDLKVIIHLGPLDKLQCEKLLPRSQGAKDLRSMLSMFTLPSLRFEVRLILRKGDVHGARLGPLGMAGSARLGLDAFVLKGEHHADRCAVRYTLSAF